MSEPIELSKWLKAQTATFETKKRMLVFTDLIYKPTGEKVTESFRYYSTPIEDVLAAFDSGDAAALAALPFALDEDGDADTSAVCLLVAFTESGSYFAAQPQEYQDYVPTLLREPKTFDAVSQDVAFALDQSR